MNLKSKISDLNTNGTHHVSRRDIESTDYYQQLSPILKKMTMQKTNVHCIQHGVNVAINIGFENWDKQTGTRYTNRMIVKEIYEELRVKSSEV